MMTFTDDDHGYLTWIAEHPKGLVLNTAQNPGLDYLVPHAAACSTISGTPARGESWTRDFIEHCSVHHAERHGFARVEGRGEAQPCGICQP